MNTACEAAIAGFCRTLRMPTLGRVWPRVAEAAQKEKRSYAEFLRTLLEEEVENRTVRRVGRRMKDARFPAPKTFEAFDWNACAGVEAAAVLTLAECGYLDERENVLFLGPIGTGKTHLAIALGIAACQRSRRVRFATAAALLTELVEAKARGDLARLLGRLGRLDLLIVDELGYVPLAKEGAELLFQVFSERHERGSVIVTTNLPFKEWGSVFPDARMAGALVDRLTHRAHVFQTQGESFRFRQAAARRAKDKAPRASSR